MLVKVEIMKRYPMLASSITVVLVALTHAANASLLREPGLSDEVGSLENSGDVVPGAYIVEWETDIKTPADFYRDLGIEAEPRMDLKYHLFNGASFRLTNTTRDEGEEVAKQIAARPEVKSIWPVRTIRIPMPEPVSVGNNLRKRVMSSASAKKRQGDGADAFTPHVMTQVDKLRAEGFTGKGIRIGIVDSGIDYTHPALGGCFGEGCLVAYGWDFVGDNYIPPAEPQADSDPFDDCVGHGTHVAGTIAARVNELGFTGAAPDVTIGMYRAWGCTGTTTNEILLAGFSRAYEDGSDIISCSAGQYTNWANDPWGITASRIVAQGVPVLVAPGNSGRNGMFFSGSPATGVNVSAVGSVDNVVKPLLLVEASYTVENNMDPPIAFGFLNGGPPFKQNVTLPLWAVSNDTTSTDDACAPLPDDTPDLSSKVVLLRAVANTPECSNWRQGENLVAKGAKYLLFYSQSNSSFQSVLPYNTGLEGVGTITPSQGAHFIESLNRGSQVTVNIVDPSVAALRYEYLDNNESGGLTSFTTSWGPTWELESKPQFTAPGGDILSTYPLALGGYAVLSGTSMSTPLAASIFALVGQARGTTDPVELRSVISSTSQPKSWYNGSNVFDIEAPVPQQGAGLIQAYAAAKAKTVLSVSQIAFNDTDHFVGTHTFSIKNTANEAVTYKLGHAKAATVYTFPAGSFEASAFPNPTVDDWADLSFSSSEITVPAGSSADITVTGIPPRNVNVTQLPVYSGWLTLSASNDESHRIPYLGVAGSMKSVRTFIEGSQYGTFLGWPNNPDPANKTFTIPRPGSPQPPGGADYPNVLGRLLFGTELGRADVVALTDTSLPTTDHFHIKSIGPLAGFPQTWMIRTGLRPGFPGTLADGTVLPEGTYKVVFSAVRVFGDRNKREDWDFAETVPFNIRYLNGTRTL